MPDRRPSEPIDWAAVRARHVTQPQVVERLVEVARRSLGQTATDLRTALDNQDLSALAFVAHALKGAGGDLAASALQDVSARTDVSARAGDPSALQLGRELDHRLQELLAALATAPTPPPSDAA